MISNITINEVSGMYSS